jgi:hypothetical protein
MPGERFIGGDNGADIPRPLAGTHRLWRACWLLRPRVREGQLSSQCYITRLVGPSFEGAPKEDEIDARPPAGRIVPTVTKPGPFVVLVTKMGGAKSPTDV